MEMHAAWVTQDGYPAIFALLMLGIVGLPVPDETLLAFAGYLVFKHTLAPAPTVLTAFLGSACGITVSYGLGRTLGLYVIRRFGPWLHVDAQKLEQVRRWYERRGKYALVVGYFIPGVRHLTAYLAGSSQLPVRVFGLFAWTGALLWSGTFIAIGYLLGEEWHGVKAAMHRGLFLSATLVLAGLAVAFWVWRRRSIEREGNP